MKPGDSDRLLTFNEGLSVRIRSEGYSMEQATSDTEPQDKAEDKAIRNLFAEMLNQVINDLRRGLSPEEMKPTVQEEVLKLRKLAIDWIYEKHESVVSLDECLFILGLCKFAFINALVAQGLLPKEETPLDDKSSEVIIYAA